MKQTDLELGSEEETVGVHEERFLKLKIQSTQALDADSQTGFSSQP